MRSLICLALVMGMTALCSAQTPAQIAAKLTAADAIVDFQEAQGDAANAHTDANDQRDYAINDVRPECIDEDYLLEGDNHITSGDIDRAVGATTYNQAGPFGTAAVDAYNDGITHWNAGEYADAADDFSTSISNSSSAYARYTTAEAKFIAARDEYCAAEVSFWNGWE